MLPADALVPDVRRIAVLRANGLGDLVVALPALEALRAAYPHARLTYLGRRHHAELIAGRPGPWDGVDVVPPYRGVVDAPGAADDSPELDEFFGRHRARRYDLALQLHGGGAFSSPFLRRLDARVVAGSRDVGAPELDRWITYAGHQHEVLRMLEVVSLVGATPVTMAPRLAVVEADRVAAAAALGPGLPVVTLHPGATDVRRRWPARSFAALADRLVDDGVRVVLVGSAAERATTAAVAAATTAPVLDLTDRLDMHGLVGVLAASALVVASDSGPRHVAEAVGTATVGVYRLAHLSHAPLTRRRHRIAVSARTTCPVCGAPADGCRHAGSWVADVGVEEVVGHAHDLLADSGAGARTSAA